MTSLQGLLKTIIDDSETWQESVSSHSLSENRKMQSQLEQLIAEHEALLEELKSAEDYLGNQIRKKEQRQEKQRRTTRSAGLGMSLRQFLCQPLLGTDALLDTLALFTKTGASVLLDGLVFKIEGKEQTARTVNEAKKLFLQDQDPWAGYHLHYVRNGQVSAGYAWDRHFLDEIFLDSR